MICNRRKNLNNFVEQFYKNVVFNLMELYSLRRQLYTITHIIRYVKVYVICSIETIKGRQRDELFFCSNTAKAQIASDTEMVICTI